MPEKLNYKPNIRKYQGKWRYFTPTPANYFGPDQNRRDLWAMQRAHDFCLARNRPAPKRY